MGPKYAKRRKVRIMAIKNQGLKPRYPRLEKYMSNTGVIVDCHRFGISEQYLPVRKPKPRIFDHFIYTIRLDKNGTQIASVPEEALEAIE